ncbi:hypothetical protein AAV35_004265 [Salimicrobium jeotgali]|uniref:General stress protein n=1 Tax=Salimicrobium jeotgali TaxID=1230341 RepID=K2FJI0_9BACI|nr:DUF948 domain-containing protein [Salimicrobium jeotgali]AKG04078.1 hypothetical protein AAV35_004265 [Salimicrobium jeotgali]EKE31196.1 general stress protein [Salimicrobium jeotgali]MBM7697242.1 uncharacterized protein YoxC [Salimicrobium jeotgali]
MDILTYVAIGVAVLALIVLAVYAVKTISTVKKTMNQANETVEGVQERTEGITTGVTTLQEKGESLTEKLNNHKELLDETIAQIKTPASKKDDFDKALSDVPTSNVRADSQEVNEVFGWVHAVLDVWGITKKYNI